MNSIWVGERVRLRGVEPDDWQGFRRFDEESADARAADILHPPRSAEGYRRWATEEAQRSVAGDTFRLAIEALEGNTLVGSINTVAPELRAGRFGYGVAIGREFHRRGYAREAITLVLGYMFGERRYQKCEVGIYGFNTGSLALHRGLGFVEEGRLRRHEFFAGGYHDLVLMGLTVEEFTAARSFFPV
jgi:RimJ/RimL family protein N-acetyltransferase